MKFPYWFLSAAIVLVSSFTSAQQRMRVVSSVPLPETATHIQWANRASCGQAGDFAMPLVPAPDEGPHEVVHVAANGALLSYFDLHRLEGYEKGWLRDAALDSSGRIVMLVGKVVAVKPGPPDAEGNSHSRSFQMERTLWVLTVDDTGKLLSTFSFDQRLLGAENLALFRSGNILLTGMVSHVPGRQTHFFPPPAVTIVSATGAIIANPKLPPPEEQRPGHLIPFSGGGDEIFLTGLGPPAYLMKVSPDGTIGPKVKLAVPEDERARVSKILGHRALAAIMPAQMITGVFAAPRSWPMAIFNTESGSLLETLLVPLSEAGPACWSDSGMTFVHLQQGTLDSLAVATEK